MAGAHGPAQLVRHDELALLYARISETLKMLEYIPIGDRDIEKKIMANLKHFIGRAGITEWELNMLHGICTRIEIKLKGRKGVLSNNIKDGN
jgi:tRNA C32,U32 (ribose-2'-O)-methylase TrmJ